MKRASLHLVFATWALICFTVLAAGQTEKGYDVEIYSEGELFAVGAAVPQPPGHFVYSFTIFNVPKGQSAQTPEGERVYAFQIIRTLAKDSVELEVLALLEDPHTVSESHPLHKFKKQAVATYTAHAGETLTLTEMMRFGVQPLEIKIVSRT